MQSNNNRILFTVLGVLIGLLYAVYQVKVRPPVEKIKIETSVVYKDSIVYAPIIKYRTITKTEVKKDTLCIGDTLVFTNTITRIDTIKDETPFTVVTDSVKNKDYKLTYNIDSKALRSFKYNLEIKKDTIITKEEKPVKKLLMTYKKGSMLLGFEFSYRNYGTGLMFYNKKIIPYLISPLFNSNNDTKKKESIQIEKQQSNKNSQGI